MNLNNNNNKNNNSTKSRNNAAGGNGGGLNGISKTTAALTSHRNTVVSKQNQTFNEDIT